LHELPGIKLNAAINRCFRRGENAEEVGKAQPTAALRIDRSMNRGGAGGTRSRWHAKSDREPPVKAVVEEGADMVDGRGGEEGKLQTGAM
jgi:hypothetical protein